MIEVRNLKKGFGDLEVLRGIDLSVETGEIFGIIGKSGEGKTTLLNCLSLLEPPDEGSIILNGQEIQSGSKKLIRQYRKSLGMIFQDFSLMERRSVYKNIALPMSCWKYSKEEIDRKVRELSRVVGVESKLSELPKVLSGGQKQRTAIARALTMDPLLLFCDEATSALDPQTTKSILALLRDINEKMKLTIIVVTHEMDVVRQICHRVAILEEGRISACGNVEDLFLEQPPALRRLLGEEEEYGLPEGVTFRIAFRNNARTNYFIPNMARELDAEFSIVSSEEEQFRDSVVTKVVLNFAETDRPGIEGYLEARGMKWTVLEACHRT